MRDIKKVIGNGGILVAEACNGFGKTACTISTILSMKEKIVYTTRTHEQAQQVLLEIERINKISKREFKAVNLASRQHLCLNEKCGGLGAMEASDVCQLLQKNEECKYKMEFGEPSALPCILSITTLQRIGRSKSICPYSLARKAASDASVTVAPYQYVFNEHIRSLIKLDISDRVLVFDEAHNADQVGQEVLSDTLSERSLINAKKELDTVEIGSGFIDDLEAFLERKVSENAVVESGTELYESLKATLRVDKLSSFASLLSEAVDKIRQQKLERGDAPVSFLSGLAHFLSLLESSSKEDYISVYRRSPYGPRLIEYHCLDPSMAVKPVVEGASGALIMSGTLSPIELFTEILGLKEAEKRTYPSIANPENVHTIIDPCVTTRFAQRGEEMTQRIGERLSGQISKIPNGVLIFFPQRRLMLAMLDSWSKVGLMRKEENHYFLGNKLLFVEGAQAVENRNVVEAYKKEVENGEGAVLCGVFRGRNSEGSNFPFEKGGGVVLVGVPYADYGDPIVRAQIDYYNKKEANLGEKWYVMDAFKAANQAMGRGIRHRDDRCTFILMDQRYRTHLPLISGWAQSGVLDVSEDCFDTE